MNWVDGENERKHEHVKKRFTPCFDTNPMIWVIVLRIEYFSAEVKPYFTKRALYYNTLFTRITGTTVCGLFLCFCLRFFSNASPFEMPWPHLWLWLPDTKQAVIKKLYQFSISTNLIWNLHIQLSPNPPRHRRLVGDLSIFHRYFHGHCSHEFNNIAPDTWRHVRSNRSFTHLHPFHCFVNYPETIAVATKSATKPKDKNIKLGEC